MENRPISVLFKGGWLFIDSRIESLLNILRTNLWILITFYVYIDIDSN